MVLLNTFKRLLAGLLLLLVVGSFAYGQSLSLSSGSASQGGSVTLNLSLTSTASLSGMQWTVSYAAGDISSLSVAAGSALTAAGKTLTCNPTRGSVTCVGVGMNANAIASGTVATVTATLASSTAGASVPISVTGASSVLADGTAATTTAAGGTISVTGWQPPVVTVSSLSCAPQSMVAPGATGCTVTLSGAAPAGGASVALMHNCAYLSVPASIAVTAGASSGSFTASAGTITTQQNTSVTATLNGKSVSAPLTLLVPGSVTGAITSYGFNEGTGTTTTDASGNGVTGQIQGATWTTSGKYGSALSFDGNSSYVDLGSPASLRSTGSMSWSAWIYATANPADDGQIIALSDNSSGWQFKTSPDTGVRTFGIAVADGSGSFTQRYSASTVSLNTWYHVAAVYNASAKTLDIYVNGVLNNGVLRGTIPAAQVVPALNATIGKRSGGFNFAGTIDNLRVYNRALTASEVQTDMATAIGVAPAPIPTLTSLLCSPAALSSGAASVCTATMSQAAQSGGVAVALSSNNALLGVPASVTVPSGATTASFNATAGAITSDQNATISASLNGSTQSAVVNLVAPTLISALACSPASLASGAASTCTVTLSKTAASALAVTLASNNALLMVPASATVAAGAASATFTATAGSIPTDQTATLTASFSGSSKSAALTLTAPTLLSSLTCSPATLNSGAASTCTVALSKAATAATAIAVSDNNAVLTVPASVTVAAGTASATFTATAGTIASDQTAVVTATLGSVSKTASLSLTAPTVLSSLTCSPASLASGATSTCTVALSKAATAATAIAVSDNNAVLSVPASVTVAAGTASATFTATAGTITSDQTAVVTATLGSVSKTASLNLTAPTVLSSVICAPVTLFSGGSSSCTVMLGKAATAATVVTISDNNAVLTVPASVTIAAGASTGSFTATAGTIASDQTAVITVTLSGASKTVTMSLVAPTVLSSLACSPTSLNAGGVSTCTVSLSKTVTVATAVALTSGNTNLTVPVSVTVAAGASTATFSATLGTCTTDQTAAVTATLGTVSKSVTLNLVAAPLISSLACTPTSLASGAASTCTVTLSKAVTAATAVAIADNNASLTVPASVTVTAGTTSATFTATAGTIASDQAATVTATLNGTSQNTTLNLVAPTVLSSLACTPTSLNPGGSSTCIITLSKTAAAATAVTLADNSASLTVPASVTVASGATTASFTATAGAIVVDQTATVTATVGSASKSVTLSLASPVVVSSLGCSPASVNAGTAATCTVNLSKAATAATVVTLSDNNAALSVPASVTVSAGAASAGFTATLAAITTDQSATVTATLGASSQTASLSLVAPVLVSSVACTPATVNSGLTTSCTVTLNKPAATSCGITLSSNSTMVTVPASVTAAAGSGTAAFTATAGAAASSQSVVLTATYNGSSSTATVTVQPPGPAATYSMNEGTGTTIGDSSGNGSTGQIQGASWTTAGKYGSALSFNGSTSYVDLGTPATLETSGSMSWSAWVKATGTPWDDGQIIARSNDTSGWQFKTSPDTGVRTFAVGVSGTGTASLTQRYSKTVLALNTWYHVAGVYNATAKTLDIYVNGVLDNGVLRGTIPASQAVPAISSTMGKRSGGFYFIGTIDEVRVYTRAITQTEIVSDMNTAVSALAPRLLTTTAAPALAPTSSTAAPDRTGGVSATRKSLSALTCTPAVANAGSRVECELRSSFSEEPLSIAIASSSDRVKVPATVVTRSRQTRLSFQAAIDATATESATITAVLGDSQLQSTVLVRPATHPVLSVPANQTARFGNRLSFEVTAFDPAGLPVEITAPVLPAGAAFDSQGHFEWTPEKTQAGTYRISFSAINSAGQSSTAEVAIEVDGGVPVLTSELKCSPGAIAMVKGRWLAAAGTSFYDPSGKGTELGGTRVTVNSIGAVILFSSPEQVNFVCPALEPGTPLSVAVETADARSAPVSTIMQEASPAIFSLDGSGANQALISFAGDRDVAMARNFRVPAHPAQPGDVMVLWTTGLGLNSDALSVTIGDAAAEIVSINDATGYTGVSLVHVRMPGTAFGDALPVQLQVSSPAGRLSSNRVTITAEPVSN